jgi:Ca-activated chloride channel family protein
VGSGLLRLEASLDQDALLANSSEDRFLVVEVSAPEIPGDVRRPVNLAVVMDTSGSMAGRGKIIQARMAAKELVDLMGPADTLSLVTFSGRARVQVESRPVTDPDGIKRIIDGIVPEGGTNLHQGLTTGQAQLQRADLQGIKRVVLLSDGKATMGATDPVELARASGQLVQEGISVSALGLGLDFDEDLLGAMSDAGGGSYSFVDRPGRLAELFARELHQMTAIAGREAAVSVKLPEGVRLQEVYGYDAAITKDGYTVFLGDVHGGETRKIVARVRVDAATGSTVDVADVNLRYANADDGELATDNEHVSARLTKDYAEVTSSLNKSATAQVARARSAKLLDQSARAWEEGDMAMNQAMLTEAEEMLMKVGDLTDDADLEKEAANYRDQRAAFGAAGPSSEEGLYQVKAAKEASRVQSRR